jgi:DNA-binding transcriptional LysR family regulator
MQTLRLFKDVARCRSFSQAAALHGITQSAASQRVSALEKRLGVTLINRSVRPLALTEAGRLFLAGCDDLLDRYDRLASKVAGLRGEPEGVVRVTAIYSAGIDLLNNVRERFEAAFPKVEVEIRYEQPDAVYQAVRGGECDLGILSYPQRWRNVGVLPLRDEPMAVVCRPDHELARRGVASLHAADLTGLDMVTFDTELPVGRRIREYLRENGAHPNITNVFDNIDTIKSAVALTDQVSILPRRTVIREVAAGALALVELEPTLVRPIGIIFRGVRSRGRAGRNGESPASVSDGGGFVPGVQAFVDFLLDYAGPNVDLAGEIVHATKRGDELVGATR